MTAVIPDRDAGAGPPADPAPPSRPWWASGPAVEVLPYGAPMPDWHAIRLTGLGGSDALAALNLSPWSTPYKLWLDKSGRLPPTPAKGRLAWGHRLEPVAADWFAELHGKQLGVTGTWRHPIPLFEVDGFARYMLCNPDRFVVGEPAGVEIKTVDDHSPDVKLWLGGSVPDYPQAQAQWCMGVTGALGWYVVAVVDGCDEPVVEYVARDDDLIGELREAAAQFCRDHLWPDVAPPADARAATSEALAVAALASITEAKEVDLAEHTADLLARRRDLKARRKALKVELDEVENEIKAQLVEAGAEYGRIGGRRAVRLARRSRAGYTVNPCEYVELREVKR